MNLKEIAAIALDEANAVEEEPKAQAEARFVQDSLFLEEAVQDAKSNKVQFFRAAVKAAPGGNAPKAPQALKPKTGAEGLSTGGKGGSAGGVVDMSKHDAEYHPHGFNPQTDTCKYRENIGKRLKNSGMYDRMTPEQQSQVREALGAKNLKKLDKAAFEKAKASGWQAEKADTGVKQDVQPKEGVNAGGEGGKQERPAAENIPGQAKLTATESQSVNKLVDVASSGREIEVGAAMEKILKNGEATAEEKVTAIGVEQAALKNHRDPIVDNFREQFGETYKNFQNDIATVPEGWVFAAGDDPWECEYMVKDGKFYRTDGKANPVGEALTADGVLADMLFHNHMWGVAMGQQSEKPAEAAPAPANAPEAAPEPEKADTGVQTTEPAKTAQKPAEAAPEAKEDDTTRVDKIIADITSPESTAERLRSDLNTAVLKAEEEFKADGDKAKFQKAVLAAKAKYDKGMAATKPKEEAPAPAAEAPEAKKPEPQTAPKAETKPEEPKEPVAKAEEPKAEKPKQEEAPKQEAPKQEEGNAEGDSASQTQTQTQGQQASAGGNGDIVSEVKNQNPVQFQKSVSDMEALQEGQTIAPKDDSGVNKFVKAADGKFYHVDDEGKPTGAGVSAAEAYASMRKHADIVPEGQSVAEHMKRCKANPPSRCPFLRKHKAELSPRDRRAVFGDEPPLSDGKPVTGAALSKLVGGDELTEGAARAIETKLDERNTGLKAEDLDALQETAAKVIGGEGALAMSKALTGIAKAARDGKIDVSDPVAREKAVMEAAEEAAKTIDDDNFGEVTINGQTYVDISDKTPSEILKLAAEIGSVGKRMITADDKKSGRWDQILAEDKTGLGAALAGAVGQQAVKSKAQQAFETMLRSLDKNKDVKDTDKAEIDQLRKEFEAGDKNDLRLMRRLEKIYNSYEKSGLEDLDSKHESGKPSSVGSYNDRIDWAADSSSLGTTKVEGERNDIPQLLHRVGEHLRLYKVPAKTNDIDVTTDSRTTVITIPLEKTVVNKQNESVPLPQKRIADLMKGLRQGGKSIKQTDVTYDEGSHSIKIRYDNTTQGKMDFGALLNDKETREYAKKHPGTFCAGTDTKTGKPVLSTLKDMIHMLVGGTTGWGKTSNIGNIAASLCAFNSPDDLEIIGIDPKTTGLPWLAKYPQTSEVVTDMDKAATKLEWIKNEMENRNKLMNIAGVATIEDYNDLGKEGKLPPGLPTKLKYIVPIIDETSDLMATHGEEVDELMERLGAKGRSSGIHMIVATQRPDATSLSTKLRANLPTVMGLRTRDKTDSRMIMGESDMGLEKIDQKGRYLLKIDGKKEPVMGDGSHLRQPELEKFGDELTKQWNDYKTKNPPPPVVSDLSDDFAVSSSKPQETKGQNP